MRAAAIAADDAAYLTAQAEAARAAIARGDGRVELDRPGFRRLPPGLQRALLRLLGRELIDPASELGLERIEAARAAILGGRGGAVVEWPGLVELRIAGRQAIFSRRR